MREMKSELQKDPVWRFGNHPPRFDPIVPWQETALVYLTGYESERTVPGGRVGQRRI